MRQLVLLLGAMSLILLIWATTRHSSAAIEADLITRTEAALSVAGVQGVTVAAEGRDVSLRGRLPSAEKEARALQIARDVWGVRIVRDNLQIYVPIVAPTPTPEPLIAPTALALTVSLPTDKDPPPGMIRIEGWAPTARARIAWIQEVQSHFGPDRVEANLKVAHIGQPTAMDATLSAALPQLRDLITGSLTITPTRLKLEGLSETRTSSEVGRALKGEVPAGIRVDVDLARPGLKVAPLPAPEACQEEVSRALRSGTLGFATGSARLLPSSDPLLNAVAKALKGCPEARFRVEGHTDNQGGARQNQRLSEARARAVMTWLEGAGIPRSRGRALGLGETAPVASNKTAKGRARNRRIELKLEGKTPR